MRFHPSLPPSPSKAGEGDFRPFCYETLNKRGQAREGYLVKPIRLSSHAREQLLFRGATEEEVIETVRTSQWQPAELGRLQCKKDFPHKQEWNKMYYNTKQVRPIFVEEETEIVIITVYSYFF
jgi:hypothetical protein